MTYVRILGVLVVATAVFWLGATVGDQRGRQTMPIEGGIVIPSADVLAPSRLAPVGSTGQVRRPRFTIELVRIDAINETGWDWPGSDELVVVYDTAEHRAVTSTFHGVDSGDQVPIPASQSCIWPIANVKGDAWTCRPQGGAAPLLFAVSLWEWDSKAYLGQFCVAGASVMPAGTALPCADDLGWLFSSRIYSYSEPDLVARLPSPGMSFDEQPHFVQHGFWNEWEYQLNVRVTRVADVLEDPPVER